MLYYKNFKFLNKGKKNKSRINPKYLHALLKTPRVHLIIGVPFAEWKVIRECFKTDVVITRETYKKIEYYAKKLYR